MTEVVEVLDPSPYEEGMSTALEVRPAGGLFRTTDPVEVVTEATRVADALKAVIVANKLFTPVQGKAHVNVEGWQLLGSMLGVTAVCTSTEKIDDKTWKATVEARDQHGRVVGQADALCSGNEKRGPWKSADDYARCSMAQTRATSKALKGPLGFVLSLAGYSTTPAEEMSFVEPDVPAADGALPEPVQEQGKGVQPGTAARPKTSPEAWAREITARVQELGLAVELREFLPSIEVEVPKSAKLAPVLPRLPQAKRALVTNWLNQQAIVKGLKDTFQAVEAA